MRYLRVKNLEKYQPQSNKRLPWIKLLTELLEPTRQPWYTELPDATKTLLHHIWLMAAALGGRIPEPWLTRERLNLKSKPNLDSILELNLVWFENEDGSVSESSHARLARSGTLSSGTLALNGEPSFSPDLAFAALWGDYPRRIGRKDALRHFLATVKVADDYALIRTALARYKAEVVGRPMQYIQHGSTWFSNWRDWAEHSEPTQSGAAASRVVTAEDVREVESELRCGWERDDVGRDIAEQWVREIRSRYVRNGLLLPEAPTLEVFCLASAPCQEREGTNA